ncbi:MAG: YjjG family noncanonical pyrimidine nucleotidase [Oscillospiraceae bacterium]|nr:YjjG family noncanonical pyrimidine nucleotidase [Oscillospiraceae bacterium]
MLSSYDVILFDADRTLFDTGAMEKEALQKLMRKMGRPYEETMPMTYYTINEGLWRRIETGELTRDYVRVERFRQFLSKYHLPGDAAEVNRTYLEIFQQCNLLIPGAELVCEKLSQENKRLAIITNGTASVQYARFALASITPYFSHVFVSEEVGVPKPQKAFFEAVLREMDIPDRRRVLIVGDSLTSDIKGGNNAGIDTCWFHPAGAQGTGDVHWEYEITALEQLLSIA